MNHTAKSVTKWDAIIIGAGASGLMCAIAAAERKRRVLLVEHNQKAGAKIAVSGGGRCNFTNTNASADYYISNNPKFCISALNNYTPWDFIAILEDYGVKFHEKQPGQLFCDDSAKQIVKLLMDRCHKTGVKFAFGCKVAKVEKNASGFSLDSSHGKLKSQKLVIATGGLSFPKLGATDIGYRIAKQFGLAITNHSPALVHLLLSADKMEHLKHLAGVALDVTVSCNNTSFSDALLFTHRGLSGPAILQISSYWQSGTTIQINLLPNINLLSHLQKCQKSNPKQSIQAILITLLPKRLGQLIAGQYSYSHKAIAECSKVQMQQIADAVNRWKVEPTATEGYRVAEVTKGGVDSQELSSKTMESIKISGLYFTGEVIDVTGHLGGFNLQWAWSSGWAAGQSI
ncbi:MAG: NAD(P)/FAD-dependent oxidoreductase [Magnetococcales bacterium]|nr:NAD(P)/FAD-dependent oxidoreductase [Magnetococcales bacterium]